MKMRLILSRLLLASLNTLVGALAFRHSPTRTQVCVPTVDVGEIYTWFYSD
jgi:hypothetical protein